MDSTIFNGSQDYLNLIDDIKQAVIKNTKHGTAPKCIVVIQDGPDLIGILNCKNFHAIRFLREILNALNPAKR